MTSQTAVRVQREAFDPGMEVGDFCRHNAMSGGVATFVGQMRDFRGDTRESGDTITAMTLEHYPGMAERQLEGLITEAKSRWPLDDVRVIHRFGTLQPGEPIVLVAVAAAHRSEAFEACAFLMDWLKTEAPFWKKDSTAAGGAWVDARAADEDKAERWRR